MTTEPDEPATESEPTAPLIPFPLHKGTQIRLGYREGTVLCVRGGRSKPYDFMVKWSDGKYPQWLLYTTAERDYQCGHLKTFV